MQIGTKIKGLRLKKGLTQEELGERTDLTKGYISQLERDLNSPSIETLFNLLEVLGCSPRDFFDDEQGNKKIVFRKEDQTFLWITIKHMKSNGLFLHQTKRKWNRFLLRYKKSRV